MSPVSTLLTKAPPRPTSTKRTTVLGWSSLPSILPWTASACKCSGFSCADAPSWLVGQQYLYGCLVKWRMLGTSTFWWPALRSATMHAPGRVHSLISSVLQHTNDHANLRQQQLQQQQVEGFRVQGAGLRVTSWSALLPCLPVENELWPAPWKFLQRSKLDFLSNDAHGRSACALR